MEIIENLLQYNNPITVNELGFNISDTYFEKDSILINLDKLPRPEKTKLETLLIKRYDSIYIYFYGYHLFNIIKNINVKDKDTNNTLIKISSLN